MFLDKVEEELKRFEGLAENWGGHSEKKPAGKTIETSLELIHDFYEYTKMTDTDFEGQVNAILDHSGHVTLEFESKPHRSNERHYLYFDIEKNDIVAEMIVMRPTEMRTIDTKKKISTKESPDYYDWVLFRK